MLYSFYLVFASIDTQYIIKYMYTLSLTNSY